MHRVQHASVKTIPESKLVDGRPFPLTFSPDSPASGADLAGFVTLNRTSLLQEVATHGAVLLRGWDAGMNKEGTAFPISDMVTAKDPPTAFTFSAAVEALGLSPTNMACSSAPRKPVAPGVWTSNEAPPAEPIPFHHEMAQCPSQPSFILFFCEKAPSAGGETPILPSLWAARYMRAKHPEVAARFAGEGIRYVRTIPDGDDESSPLGRSWQSTFAAETREDAEKAIAANEMTFEWLANGDVRCVSKVMPFFTTHHNGKEMFYNAAVAALLGWGDARNDATKAMTFGGGAALDKPAIDALYDTARYMQQIQVAFKWQVAAPDVLCSCLSFCFSSISALTTIHTGCICAFAFDSTSSGLPFYTVSSPRFPAPPPRLISGWRPAHP